MKTIFITSFHPLISRNILQTRLLSLLSEKGKRVVILVPDFKKDYFVKNFSSSNIFIEGINTSLTKKDLFFRKLALALTPTHTLYIKKRSEFYRNKNILKFIVSVLPAYLLGQFKYGVRLFQFFDYKFLKPQTIHLLLDKYKPDLIFSTDAQNEIDVRLLQESKRAGLKTVAMIRSWDNLTTKGMLRVIPDRLVVHNEIIKKEAMQYSYVDNKRILIAGIPHYDRYLKGPTKTKEEFFKKYNFDLNKKLILVAPIGNRYIFTNQTDRRVLEGLSKLDANILVRVPPCDVVDYKGFSGGNTKIVFDYSGASSWKGGRKVNELSKEEDDRLINSLHWSNVVVTHLATICIDAAFFDKPIVAIGTKFSNYVRWDNIRYYFDYDHPKPVIKSRGIKIVNNKEELLLGVKNYLNNPSLDASGRQKIVREQAQFLDGNATRRLADILLE